jgi:NAD(P)-dependent dehydrogenase (short-subunit alcohol dehydrogenase family)
MMSSMENEPKYLSEKVAIVTGASRGIGRAIAIRLARAGAKLVLAARDAAKLDEAVGEITQIGAQAIRCALDLRNPQEPAELVAQAVDTFGTIDIVVNNAGATKRGDFLELTEEDWADGFALKFFGYVRLLRAAWPLLQRQGGSVVNIIGIGGRTPGAEFAIGGSVNAALLSLTKALADRGIADGVQVNAINPGLVRTDRLRARLEKLAADQKISIEAAAQRIVQLTETTRIGEPEDIANLVAFLVSPEARFLQSALIDMDGGATKTI